MCTYKNSKWAGRILALQREDGSWGDFHSLSLTGDSVYTTEQALRRLRVLGYTIEDECIARAVSYMSDCLKGIKEIPDRREKLHDWNVFTSMILSADIRLFTEENEAANRVASAWRGVISQAFADGTYDAGRYVKAFEDTFGIRMNPKAGRLADFVNFYQVSLVSKGLEAGTERAVFDYILGHENGMYYIYDGKLSEVPAVFESITASRYLGAVEVLADYRQSADKLQFAATWLLENQKADGKWDMGSKVNDKVYFPLSDDWRKKETREADCTYRIGKLLEKIGM